MTGWRQQDGCWGFWKNCITFQKEAPDKVRVSVSGHPHVSTWAQPSCDQEES